MLPGGKLIGKRAVVFVGDVENSGAIAPVAIVLEKPDAQYKKMITVETRRTGGGGQGDTGGANGATAGGGLPAGAVPQ